MDIKSESDARTFEDAVENPVKNAVENIACSDRQMRDLTPRECKALGYAKSKS